MQWLEALEKLGKSAPRFLKLFTRVKISGLKSKPELNEKGGVVLGYRGLDRYLVAVDDSGNEDLPALKSTNLSPCLEWSSSDHASAAAEAPTEDKKSASGFLPPSRTGGATPTPTAPAAGGSSASSRPPSAATPEGADLHVLHRAFPSAELVDQAGQQQKLKDGETVLLYFSGHWCPPCQAFTPQLKAYTETHFGASVRVVFVSADRSKEAYSDYWKTMGEDWLAVTWDHHLLESMATYYGLDGIPAVVSLVNQRPSLTSSSVEAVANGKLMEDFMEDLFMVGGFCGKLVGAVLV